MSIELMTMLAQLAAGLIRRHYEATGTILTDEQIASQLEAELRDGESLIVQWFLSKGLPVPH